MRKLFFASIILFSLLFSSCATDYLVPGRKGVAIRNIYQEYLNIGDAYYDLKKYDKALTYYKQASENKTFFWACTYKMADTYFRQGNWEEAEKLYEKLITRDENNLQIKEALAYVYASEGKFDEALKIYSDLQEKFPENQSFLENQIVLLITSGDQDTAREKIENLKSIFPENKKAETYLKKLDENQPAVEENEKAPEPEESEASVETAAESIIQN